ncbi:MAG: hypothetical protein SF052_27765 [Bacteroidia bacterium]|nr:hypothetical protein [Bacteroidia bacterium]
MLETLASGFGESLHKVVFIGGATLSLYVTDRSAPECHPSGDIDGIVGGSSMIEFLEFQQIIEKKGFKRMKLSRPGAEQWMYEGIKVRLMPMNTEKIGFTNRWYEEGVFHARTYRLPGGRPIRIFMPAYFMASKIDAFLNRGGTDLRMSEDFQDLVYLLDNRQEILDDIQQAFYEVRSYIQQQFARFLTLSHLDEGIAYALPDSFDEENILRIRQIMEKIATPKIASVRA